MTTAISVKTASAPSTATAKRPKTPQTPPTPTKKTATAAAISLKPPNGNRPVSPSTAKPKIKVNSSLASKAGNIQVKSKAVAKPKQRLPVPAASSTILAIPQLAKPASPSKKMHSMASAPAIRKSAPDETLLLVELEATLCPICEEACTCPKSAVVTVAAPSGAAMASATAAGKKKTTKTVAAKPTKFEKPGKQTKKSKKSRRDLESHFASDADEDYDSDSDSEHGTFVSAAAWPRQQSTKAGENDGGDEEEDSALSFVRMIYSDEEESLDEEEAFALYQAVQLMSSSDEEWATELSGSDADIRTNSYVSDAASGFDSEEYDNDHGSDTDAENEGSESDESFEYAVVECIPSKRKNRKNSREFVAYSSEDDIVDQVHSNSINNSSSSNSSNNNNSSSNSNSLFTLNATNTPASAASASPCDDESADWMTWSVLDLSADDQEIILSRASNQSDALQTTASSLGTDSNRIPIIAPQVLAAISAAAKSMAAAQSGNDGNVPTTRYFTYITSASTAPSTEGPEAMPADDGEYLFFEEDASDADALQCEDDLVDLDVEEDNVLYVEGGESQVDSEEDDNAFEEKGSRGRNLKRPSTTPLPSPKTTKPRTLKQKNGPAAAAAHISNTLLSDYRAAMKRWSRIPIGAFRRSRRPSLPRLVPPANAVRAARSEWLNGTTLAGNVLNDRFPHSYYDQERDAEEDGSLASSDDSGELLSISGGHTLPPTASPIRPFSHFAPLDDDLPAFLDLCGPATKASSNSPPLRSRSVINIPTHHNTAEWLNSPWHLI